MNPNRSLILRRAVLGGGVLWAALQFVPVERTNPPVETEVPAPANVRAALRHACYDCHSNETVWPWYSRVAPVSFLIARDVTVGRAELNFSTWNRMTGREQAEKLEETWESVAEGEMPPWFYVSLHPDAALSPEDRATLRTWAAGPEAVTASGVDVPRGDARAPGHEDD